jgi:hypothetical protein
VLDVPTGSLGSGSNVGASKKGYRIGSKANLQELHSEGYDTIIDGSLAAKEEFGFPTSTNDRPVETPTLPTASATMTTGKFRALFDCGKNFARTVQFRAFALGRWIDPCTCA